MTDANNLITADPEDFSYPPSVSLRFGAYQTSISYAINTTDDSISEYTEMFFVKLAAPGQSYPTVSITILDDDSKS